MRRALIKLFALLPAVLLLSVVLLGASPASATWSIVGVDPETGEVGVAVASCVPLSQLGDASKPLFLMALVPGVGAGISQAELNPEAPPRMATLLDIGKQANEVIADVSSPEFDAKPQARQHGVVVLDGEASGFTGTGNGTFAGDKQSFGVSVQGNILVGETVVDDALAAFERASEQPLADRLVAALLAGSEAGGDSRCAQTALFAQVVVADRDDNVSNPSVILTYGSKGENDNPVQALAQGFAAGERRILVVPEGTGLGSVVGMVGLALAALMILGGVLLWRNGKRSGTRY